MSIFEGEAFDTTQAVNYAVSNIVVSIIYGSRFEYSDPRFIVMVQQTMKRLKIVATAPIQVQRVSAAVQLVVNAAECCPTSSLQIYNIFPLIGRWFSARKEIHRVNAFIRKQNLEIFSRLKKTLNPQMCRGLVDAFLVQQQSLQVWFSSLLHPNSNNDNSQWFWFVPLPALMRFPRRTLATPPVTTTTRTSW